MAGRGRDRGRGPSRERGRGNFGGGRGRSNDNNMRQGGQGYTNRHLFNNDHHLCQVCFKRGHTAAECWHRFDEDYTPDAAATSSYNIDTNWYADTGSTDHITNNLEKLSAREKYNGGEQIHTANGTGNWSCWSF